MVIGESVNRVCGMVTRVFDPPQRCSFNLKAERIGPWSAVRTLARHGRQSEVHAARALPKSCLSWPPTQAGRLELGTLGVTPGAAPTRCGEAAWPKKVSRRCQMARLLCRRHVWLRTSLIPAGYGTSLCPSAVAKRHAPLHAHPSREGLKGTVLVSSGNLSPWRFRG